MPTKLRIILLPTLFILLALIATFISFGPHPIAPVQAATFTVTNLNDSGPGSLRQAIIDANDEVTNPGTDSIDFSVGGTITLASQLVVSSEITINGGGTVAISGNNAVRVFWLTGTGDLTLDNITVRDGNSNFGGGIRNYGALTVQNSSTVSNNTALLGGGIFNFNTVTMQSGVTVSGNTATWDGGGIYSVGASATVTIQSGATVSNNTAKQRGGGIYNWDSTVTITDVGTTVSGNTAATIGGGIYSVGASATVTVQNGVLVSNNMAALVGGGIYNERGTVTVIGSLIIGNSTAWYSESSTNIDSVTGSCIIGNGNTAVTDLGGPVMTATGNWWGAIDGPGPVGPGSGDTVSTNVDYSGFLTEPVLACPAPPVLLPPVWPPPPPVPLCADFDTSTNDIARANIPDGTVTNGSVFCRVLVENREFVQQAAEIGIPEVLNRGVIQAVDAFGLFHDGTPTAFFNNPVAICLRGSGAFLYLDATVAPRTVIELPVFMQNGYSCANIPNAGTVVLVNGAASMVNPAPTAEGGPTTVLNDCMVTTHDILNLRETPSASGTVLHMIPYDVTLTAFERTSGWFYVDYLGEHGWISAGYVTPQGTCDP